MRTPFPKYDADLVAAIEEHLQLDAMTEIVELEIEWMHCADVDHGLKFPMARGLLESSVQPYRNYSRPMFQLYHDGVTSALSHRSASTACPDCDNFAYTSKCTTHSEQALAAKGLGRHPDGQPITQVSFNLHRPTCAMLAAEARALSDQVTGHRSIATSNLSHLADSLRYLLEGAWNNGPQLVRVESQDLSGNDLVITFAAEAGSDDR